MAVQNYRKINSYDKIEKFKGCKVPAFSLFINKTLSRTYCSCGKAYAGIKDRCECGNPVTEHFEYDNSAQNIKFFCKKEVDREGNKDGKLIVGYEYLRFDTSKGYPKEMVAEYYKNDSFIISKDGFEKISGFPFRYNDFGFYKFIKKCFKEWVFYNEYSFWFEKLEVFHSDISAVEMTLNFEYTYPQIYNDPTIFQYPYLIAYCLDESRFSSYKSFKDYFLDRISKDVSHMDILNYYLYTIYEKEKGQKDLYSYGYRTSATNLLCDYIKVTSLSYEGSYIEESVNLIKHYVSNHMLTIAEALSILKLLNSIIDNPTKPKEFSYDYKYFDTYYHKEKDPYLKDFFRVEYLEFFHIFLKENVSIVEEKGLLPYLYIERLRKMKDLGIPVKADNFKIKNYNWITTNKLMASEYKLPEQKVELFLDMFETNPLESLELVSNRRKLTEKQIFALIDKMAKK